MDDDPAIIDSKAKAKTADSRRSKRMAQRSSSYERAAAATGYNYFQDPTRKLGGQTQLSESRGQVGRGPSTMANQPAQDSGPWNGDFVGWKKRGRVWHKKFWRCRTTQGGVAPVPGEIWRSVRWTESNPTETLVVIKLRFRRTIFLKGTVTVGSDGPDGPDDPVDPDSGGLKNLHQSWTHSYEEEKKDSGSIFRPTNYKVFPTSRFRLRMVFFPDGYFLWLYLAPDNRHYLMSGHWTLDPREKDVIHIRGDLGGQSSFRILELKKDLLRIEATRRPHVNPYFLKQGLVAYYPFNGNTKDESGNGNDGKASEVTLARDRNGYNQRAAFFSGQRPHILVRNPDSRFNLQEFTLSAWVATDKNSAHMPVIYKLSRGSSNEENYKLALVGENAAVSVEQNDGKDHNAKTPFLLGQGFVHLAGTYDGQSLKLYMNGELKATTAVGGRALYSGKDKELLIGDCSNRDQGKASFSGAIDDVRIYNRALSEAEVKALYEFEKAP